MTGEKLRECLVALLKNAADEIEDGDLCYGIVDATHAALFGLAATIPVNDNISEEIGVIIDQIRVDLLQYIIDLKEMEPSNN